jgi:hypothetical protein
VNSEPTYKFANEERDAGPVTDVAPTLPVGETSDGGRSVPDASVTRDDSISQAGAHPLKDRGEVVRLMPEQITVRVGEISWVESAQELEINLNGGRGTIHRTYALRADKLEVRFELSRENPGSVNWCRTLSSFASRGSTCYWGGGKYEGQIAFLKRDSAGTLTIEETSRRVILPDGTSTHFARPSHLAAHGDVLFLNDIGGSMGSLVRWKNGDARVVLSGALFDHPSGVAIASDGKAIWLSTSGYSTQHSALYRLPLSADSQLGTPELIASGLTGAAGIAVDIEDNAYVANGKDITVFSHSGTSLGSIPVLAPESRERVLDLAFGGSNRTTLFIGTGTDLGGAFTPMGQYVGGLYSVKLRMPGIRR